MNQIVETMSMMLHTMRTDLNVKQYQVELFFRKKNLIIYIQNETYVKFLPTSDEASPTNNHNDANPDQGQLSREDLKFSGRNFLIF